MQNYEQKSEKIRSMFRELKKNDPERLANRLNLSWSNWGFGVETLDDTAKRLNQYGVKYIELHGNHYGPDLGYRPSEVKQVLQDWGIEVSGVCGMFSRENDLSSNIARHRQEAIDYIRRETEFTAAVKGHYLLVVPGAVGRAQKYDDMEWERSIETLQTVADEFCNWNIKAAIEPIRAAETSLVHTVAAAQAYIKDVNHPGIRHINGDIYHMLVEETHIGEAIMQAGDQLVNLHLADSNRGALGEGHMDLDTIIMALYLIGFNQAGRFVTPEPLGPGGDPYPAMFGRPDKELLDALVRKTVSYFREREAILIES
ncbi:sugar phosphate isomerase/epimerase family protein [Paenibacillus sp. Soil522]|uniref:sugar phosphate isomerase/epimerase family protein n=1 Tax=Paenibacillus sp. Soil522 TaxID=1736388 RepID=UPI0006FBD088|nr:sugar phosphate isomerase/epimerase [Paenibacillus sp. Soil522]KRE29820.1 sugar phosphate isomerase [Paenibacillus sp. Soil522]